METVTQSQCSFFRLGNHPMHRGRWASRPLPAPGHGIVSPGPPFTTVMMRSQLLVTSQRSKMDMRETHGSWWRSTSMVAIGVVLLLCRISRSADFVGSIYDPINRAEPSFAQ